MMLVDSPLLEWITNMSLFYRAEGATYNYETQQGIVEDIIYYESAIVLYGGTPPATPVHAISDVHVVRGESIANFKTETFEIPSDGIYFVAFYSGSYDRTGAGVAEFGIPDIEASMYVGEVSVSTPKKVLLPN
jgi:hypothetical protein